jgi:hypothetical protein
MVGVGRVFEAFRDGLLEDDDEVALVHGPAESGFRAISEPMVNIRATLSLARAEGILGDDEMSALVAIAKSLFYKDRSYPALLRCGLTAGLAEEKVEALRTWLPTNRVDQKKQDAVEMLRLMAAEIGAATPSKTVHYRTEQTEWWQAAKDHFAAFPMTAHLDASALELFLDEVRLDLQAFPALRRNAMVRHLAALEAERQGWEPDRQLLQNAADAFRRKRDLLNPEEMAVWLLRNDLNRQDFSRMIRDTVLTGILSARIGQAIICPIVDELRNSGQYEPRMGRALKKHQALAERGMLDPAFEPAGLFQERAIEWFFHRHGRSVPDDLDAFARTFAYEDKNGLLRAILREYAFVELLEGDPQWHDGSCDQMSKSR